MATISTFEKFIAVLNHAKKSIKNFAKSSFLSLLIITIILLLLTQMDQAFTMMVDLIENKNARFSLFLSFFFINAFAIVLSHYPIYNYYASNLNNSGNYTRWHSTHPFSFWPLKKFTVYVFTTVKQSGYTPDNWANYLRYLIGILIHFVWIHFIISSFAPNLLFENFPLPVLKVIVYTLLVVPFVLYIILKEKFTNYQAKEDKEGKKLTPEERKRNGEKLNGLYQRLGIYYFLVALITVILFLITMLTANFSPGGLVVILLTSYAFVFNYVFFRLLRTRLSHVKKTLATPLLRPVQFFVNLLLFLQKSRNYLALFNSCFLVALLVLIYATLGSLFDWELSNGIPILLAFFFFYYFIIASLGKYLFVAEKMNLYKSKTYKSIFVVTTLLIVLALIGKFSNAENTTHELDIVPSADQEISEQQFIKALENKNNETLFLIASHGGGLKANVWTLNVLNKLQEETQGNLLEHTIALSGASGGSLGLALYTGLFRADGKNTKIIQKKIDYLSRQNYTSIDLSLTFGLDTYRKLWPFNQKIGVRDRPYYKMRKYQNTIESTTTKTLSAIPFRTYWAETYNKYNYFPSLVMNTAGTKGNRGVLWSVKQNNFNTIFPFAENLADLSNGQTLPYYQAVSTTNRFPVFSPAAKIPGYGHFIDAGAIDNSGLLGCLDIHNHLIRTTTLIQEKNIAYIEIINGKSLYINYLVEKFKLQKGIKHIDKNENETDNIVADLQTGLNLDKIPGYLSAYMKNWEQSEVSKVRYFQLFMPHKVSIENVKSFLNGDIKDPLIEQQLEDFLNKENDQILALTEKPNKSFFDPWEYYEPTLSRHLSKSSLRYVHAIMKHPILEHQFMEISALANAPTPLKKADSIPTLK